MCKSFNSPIGDPGLTKIKRAIQLALMAGMLIALLSYPGKALGQAAEPSNPFVVVLRGTFEPAEHTPDFGLSEVDLNDGAFLTVPIYAVSGVPGPENEQPIGSFYVRVSSPKVCAYHLPGGSFGAKFISSNTTVTLDGSGGVYKTGTYELEILEGTGIYRPFAGGHIQMVDVLQITAAGVLNEISCFCHVSY